ncbi:hypothetical protein ACGF8B_08345 [Streptomyces sp. NPDC047917]|uniref:hypothetical protein n=1 Tax=Streptomyces sp. NPDC047917 TaxID=3365491 RepID=UPI0037187D7B
MERLPWAISSVGVAFLCTAAVGHCNSPAGPADAVRIHRVCRVLLPLVLGCAFFAGWFPQALGTPWIVAAVCRLIAVAPAVLIFFAARRRTD